MNLEKIKLTVGLVTAFSIISGVVYSTWYLSSEAYGFKSEINSRFQTIENKVEIMDDKQDNQYISSKNDRKRDSAMIMNGQLEIKGELREMQKILFRTRFSNGQLGEN